VGERGRGELIVPKNSMITLNSRTLSTCCRKQINSERYSGGMAQMVRYLLVSMSSNSNITKKNTDFWSSLNGEQ
jgi:hypothetical protein